MAFCAWQLFCGWRTAFRRLANFLWSKNRVQVAFRGFAEAKTSRRARSWRCKGSHDAYSGRTSQPPLSRWRRDSAISWTAHRSSCRPTRRVRRASESPDGSTRASGNERILRADGVGRSPRAARSRTAPRCRRGALCAFWRPESAVSTATAITTIIIYTSTVPLAQLWPSASCTSGCSRRSARCACSAARR